MMEETLRCAIIATLGPASSDVSIWREMLAAGATAFRLNTAHLSLPQLDEWLDRLIPFLASLAPRPALVLDLQGSKWRLGMFWARQLAEGDSVELVLGATEDRPGVLPVPHTDFFQAASLSNGEIVLNDARVRLRVETYGTESIQARVVQGGPLAARKGITYAQSTFRREGLGEQDRAIVAKARWHDSIRYAISYVRDVEEMARYRAVLGRDAYLIAKLERQPAVDDADAIGECADELWLCRGDLGAELGDRRMAEAVHRFSKRVAQITRPVLLAGQVLEHMTEHPTPTRSELCYLFDALHEGYRGVVLSDETAMGRDPVAACRAAALFVQDEQTYK